MEGYSLGGFLNATLRRSGRTLLVEGIYDQSLLNRLRLETAKSPASLGQIDCVEIVRDATLSGLGMKARIGAVRAFISTLPEAHQANVEAKLGTLVDREWDGLDIGMKLEQPWTPPTQHVSAFTTMGHSIENYFFNAEGASAYLKMFFADHIGDQLLRDLSARFHEMVALAIIYSLAIRGAQGLKRADGLVSSDYVSWDKGRYVLLPSINGPMTARGINIGNDFDEVVNRNIDYYLSENKELEPGRWICHGHLGHQAIWACISHLATEHGVNADCCTSIERGEHKYKFRHSADTLCGVAAAERAPLDDVLDWLST